MFLFADIIPKKIKAIDYLKMMKKLEEEESWFQICKEMNKYNTAAFHLSALILEVILKVYR